MPGIDDIMIDATTNEGINDIIKRNEENNTNKVVMQSPRSKSVVLPKKNVTNNDRTEFDISSLAPSADEIEDKENIHKSIPDDILSGRNPMLKNYVENKKREMQEWIAEKEEEEMLNRQEKELDELSNDESVFISNSQEKEEDDVISNSLKYEEKEDRREDNIQLMEDEDIMTEINNIKNNEEIEIKEEKAPNIDVSDINLDDLETSTTHIDGLDEVEDDDEIEEDKKNEEDDTIKHLQQLATERLKPVSRNLNISSFTILQKPTANTKFLEQKPVKVAKWVLPNQQSIVLMKEFLGSELEQLRQFSADRTSAIAMNSKFKLIYDHIATPDKPTTYEAWVKSTPFSDIDHYFFAIYYANFKGANYIPVDCPNDKCKETFLSNDIPIMDMVKFESDEAKSKFQKLYQNENIVANPKGLYTTEIIPLSENIAVGFKEPSIYNIIEIASIDSRFRERYASVLDYIPYIDALYIINVEQQTLEPIGFKGYIDNATKTVKSKIQKYDSILRTLSADEFGIISPYIQAINERSTGFNYQFPAIECPKCHTLTTAQNVSAEDMVFTRCQLGKLVTTSLN